MSYIGGNDLVFDKKGEIIQNKPERILESSDEFEIIFFYYFVIKYFIL